MNPVIGIEKLYVALQTKDDSTGLTYAAPKYYENIKELGIKPKQNTERLYAENRLIDQVTAFDSADVEALIASLTSAQKAELLGQTIAAAGGVYAKSTDVAPYVAILYKATIRGGFRYGVMYKGAFTIPDDDIKGQEGKIIFQSPKVSAVFQPTNYNKMWEYHVDTTDPNCPADIDTTWFTTVTIPGADTVAPTVTTVPANAATAIAITANIVWTFNEAIDASGVDASNFFLIKTTDGTITAGALTIDGTSKIVTLDPTASMTAATAYIAVCTTDVTDVAGNHLAATSVAKFTTA